MILKYEDFWKKIELKPKRKRFVKFLGSNAGLPPHFPTDKKT